MAGCKLHFSLSGSWCLLMMFSWQEPFPELIVLFTRCLWGCFSLFSLEGAASSSHGFCLWMFSWQDYLKIKQNSIYLFYWPCSKPRGARLSWPCLMSFSSLCAYLRQNLSFWHAALGKQWQRGVPHLKVRGCQGEHFCLCLLPGLSQSGWVSSVCFGSWIRLSNMSLISYFSYPMLTWKDGIKDKTCDILQRAHRLVW